MENDRGRREISVTPSDSSYASAVSGRDRDELSEAFNNQLNIQSTLFSPEPSPPLIIAVHSTVKSLLVASSIPFETSPSILFPSTNIPPTPFSEQLQTPPAISFPNPLDSVSSNRLRTAVIFQDACTNHRYTRTNDVASLMSIVERPERIRAIKVGVANAWARLETKRVAKGEKKWEKKNEVLPKNETEGGVDLLDELMSGLGLKDVKGKGKGKEVMGGPFDILFSTSVLPVNDSALLYVHPLPNLPPSPPAPYPLPLPSTSTVQIPTTPTNRSKSVAELSSAPSKLYRLDDEVIPVPIPAWPFQLQKLCRDSTLAIGSAPTYSEIPKHLPQGDLYLSEGSEEAIFGAMGAVCEGVDRIMKGVRSGEGYDRAFVAIRPPGHHCCEDQPMGFCFVNNVAVAAAHAYQKHGVDRVIILDIDLHHGNGTQDIAWRINADANSAAIAPQASPKKGSPKKVVKRRELQVMYGSLHDVFSYPCEDGDASMIQAASLNLSGGHSQYISNVHLDSWSTEEDFYERLYPRYISGLLGAATEFCHKTKTEGVDEDVSDKTIVIISAGFDASEHESAGMSRHRRNVPTSFYHRFALDAARFANLYAGGKILSVLEGGYSDRALASGTLAMMTGLTEASRGKEVESTNADVSHWWEEKVLVQVEKGCKPTKKGGKLTATSSSYSSVLAGPSLPTSPSSKSVSEQQQQETWLSKTIEIFSIIEGTEISETQSAKEKKELLSRTMQLRERRPQRNLTSEDSTPVATPTRKNVRTTSKIIVPELPLEVIKVKVEELPVVPTKIKFTFKAGL